MTNSRPRNVALIFTILLIPLFLTLFLTERENIFTINVTTEIAHLKITNSALTEWTIPEGKYYDDPFTETPKGNIALGSTLNLEPGTEVEIHRNKNNIMTIVLRHENKMIGTLQSSSDTHILKDWAILSLTTKKMIQLLPFQATLTLGNDVGVGTSSIMTEGKITIVEKQLWGGERYTAGENELDPGDKIKLMRKNKTAIVSGFIRITDDANLKIVVHGIADFAKVERLGSSGYSIKPSLLARVINDPLLSALTVILGLLVLLVELFSQLKNIFSSNS